MVSVEARKLTVKYGAFTALETLDLHVGDGEFLVLLGPSGCGKSTLLNTIAGLENASDGQVWIGDRNVTWAEPKDRDLAMVFQSYALYPKMSVRRNLSFGLEVARMPKAEIEARVARAAEALKLTQVMDRKPSELSGGQRQRVAIGRVLVRDTKVFLFDEPLSNLDAQLRSELRREIKRLHKSLQATSIYVTHDQIEALTLADRIAVMNTGRIEQIGSPEEIYERPATRYVAAFIGSPAINFLDATLEMRAGKPVILWGGREIDASAYAFSRGAAEGKVELGIRPEAIVYGEAAETSDVALSPVVDLIEPMGAETLVWCKTEAGEAISFRATGAHPAVEDAPVRIGFNVADLSIFGADGVRL